MTADRLALRRSQGSSQGRTNKLTCLDTWEALAADGPALGRSRSPLVALIATKQALSDEMTKALA
jgi:hypothetical protein